MQQGVDLVVKMMKRKSADRSRVGYGTAIASLGRRGHLSEMNRCFEEMIANRQDPSPATGALAYPSPVMMECASGRARSGERR